MELEQEISEKDKIKIGQYIIIQRQKYTKLHKFSTLESTVMLGKDQIMLGNINEEPFFSTFKMNLQGKQSKRLYTLEMCSDIRDLNEALGERESGSDNRNIIDDGQSQKLSLEEISRLREGELCSSEIVGRLVENSKTFASKTEYSQEKYLKKKEKKYFEYVQIRRPSLRIITDIFYRQDAAKIMGLRPDSIGQILCYANINCNGTHLLYESGTNGLLPSAVLNAVGENSTGVLIHLHPGNVPQKQGLLALNYPTEQLERCISVNLYSVLRCLHQQTAENKDVSNERKRKNENDSNDSTPVKVAKTEAAIESLEISVNNKPDLVKSVTPNVPVRQRWELDNEKACTYLIKRDLDSLIICAKEHPVNIADALLPMVRNSAPIVVFSLTREPLLELYNHFKQNGNVTGLRLISNWSRAYQVLPNRTHPDVNMAASSGYLLTGWVVR